MSTPRPQFVRVPQDINVSLLQEALVVIVGVGMVGSQIAEGLARFTVGNIRLIDHEPYEWENTLRHALPVEYNGWNKAIALEDWLPKQIEGLRVEAIPRKVDTSISDDELDHWLGDADLVVAATDDREAQRRIGRRALAKEVAAVFPALYPRRGGGEVILQLVPELPCFGCWDYFRRDTEQLRGQRALDLDAQPVIFHAEQLCLGALDPDSRRRDLLRADPPHQVVMVDRIGVPSFGSITRRLDCPSCGGGPVPSRPVHIAEAWPQTPPPPFTPSEIIRSAVRPRRRGLQFVGNVGSFVLALAFAAAPVGVMYFVAPAANAHPNIALDIVSLGCVGWLIAGMLAVFRAFINLFSRY